VAPRQGRPGQILRNPLGPAADRAIEAVKFGDAAQDDVDRALPVLDVVVADVSKDASFGRFFDEDVCAY
jgi:hypothetical protein